MHGRVMFPSRERLDLYTEPIMYLQTRTLPSPSYINLSLAAAVIAAFLALPMPAQAADLEVSGWIPYWATSAGVKEATKNIRLLDEVNPFAYSVTTTGALSDTLNIESSNWRKLEALAERRDVRFIPTVMWSDRSAMETVLNDPALRSAHVRAIVTEITDQGFDGVDIDYENKSAETRVGFSAFLKELSDGLKDEDENLMLQCTIEARMPLSARYAGTPPANIEYANDLRAINRACDTVRIMTYDQQTADIELQREHYGTPYAPVSDVEWTRKVVEYMGEDIDYDKMVIGIPTYGRKYQLMPSTSGTGFEYTHLGAFIPSWATKEAKKYKLKVGRNGSGEAFFTYVPKDTHRDLPNQKELAAEAPRGTSTYDQAWKGALKLADEEGKQSPFVLATWSDAAAIKQKVELAEELDLRGVAIFSIGGTADRGLWRAVR